MNKPTIVATLLSPCRSGSGRISTIRFSYLRFLLCCLWLFVGLLLAGSPVQAEIKAGDILVIDQGMGALFVVNPTTGQRTVLSDFSNPLQGSFATGWLASVAVGAAGRIFVTTSSAALVEVDSDTGYRTLLSNFSQGDIQGHPSYGLAVDAKGRVITTLQNFDPLLSKFDAAVVRVDPDTDERTVVTDLTNPRQGGPDEGTGGTVVGDLALERSGKILISTFAGVDLSGTAIFRVHPVTGKRKLLSDFANAEQGVPASLYPFIGMAVEKSGQVLVIAQENFWGILRVDPKTGQRTVLSDRYDFETLCPGPYGLAVESSGDIVVSAANPDPFTVSLFRVNSSTGHCTMLSDSANPVQGPSFNVVTYIAVVPKDSDVKSHN